MRSPLPSWNDRGPGAVPAKVFGAVRWLVHGAVILWGFLVPVAATGAGPAWVEGHGYRHAPLPVPASGHVGFTLLEPRTTGLAFTNAIPESRHLTNQVLLNGSGLAAGDVDGDGLVDVFCAGFDDDNALFRNLGNWRFEEIGAAAGVALPGLDCTGAAFVDLDGDGDLDLVVDTLGQGTYLLYNDGHGRFTRSPAVLNPGRAGMTVAAGDFDGDGRPDLYIANYRTRALMDMPGVRMTFKKVGGRTVVDTVAGRPATDPEFAGRFVVNEHGGIEENGEPDVLYRNVDGTNFVEVSWTGGAFLDEAGEPLKEAPRDWGLAAMFHDVNGDGRPDLYVCNDFQSPDRLWLNLGGGRFRLAPALALRRTSLSSMAVDFADVDRDGNDDFVVLEMMSRDHRQRMRWVRENFPHRPVVGRFDDRPQLEQNTLQLGRGDGTWAEVAQFAGLEAAEWAWSGAFLDVDLDGWPDLLVVNGMERAGRDLDVVERLKAARAGKRVSEAEVFQGRRMFPRLTTPNLAFRNRGDLTFQETGNAWGFELAAVSQAIALADLDGDGDLDVLVGNLNAAVAVYRNDGVAPRVAVRLAGRAPNTRGLGARIDVSTPSAAAAEPGPVTRRPLAPQSQEMTAGGRYLSGDDPMRTFGTGNATSVTVRVHWPSGAISEIGSVGPNSLVEIAEPEPPTPGRAATDPAPALARAGAGHLRFEDESARLNHRHHEEAFDDYSRQPLLPYKLSQPGPGLAWVDWDGDGDDDLFIGSGRGGRLAAFRNEGGGRLVPWDAPALQVPLARDAVGLAVWPNDAGGPRLLVGLSNYEDGAAVGPAVLAWDPKKFAPEEVIEADEASAGSIAVADIDGDGDLDAFLGGRVVPSKWPVAAPSRFLRNDRGRLVVDTVRSRAVAALGLVTAAVFTDFDGDGDADLVVACEWGPMRVLRQDAGGFVDVTDALGLGAWRGGWTSVAVGDFDEDGRLDFVAGNWGRNTPYERFRQRPAGRTNGPPEELLVYHGDFNGDGVHDVLEAYHDAFLGKIVPREQLGTLLGSLPFLRERFASNAAFGEADVAQVLGAAFATAKTERLAWVESAVFLNRGDHFEIHALPVAAQLAPTMGVVVADADGDGHEDVFLSQNFFPLRPHAPRCDAGTGLWLRGDGRGGFEPVPGSESGVRLDGEQRGAAVSDYDGDGRVDLVVGQNGAATRLFRNTAAIPGLRVRLDGGPANPGGVGARLRWKEVPSPLREIHGGGGALSQDSWVVVLARPTGASTLVVTWPGGTRTEQKVPVGAREIRVSPGGARGAR